MRSIVNFTPRPSQIYFTVEDHLRVAFRAGVPSLSHRSKDFEKIFQKTTQGLKELLGIPSSFHIFFTSSATEIWERSIENLVEKKSLHFVNGSFSKRYYEIAKQLGKDAEQVEVQAGQGFSSNQSAAQDVELIALTHNETSTGVSLPLDFIHSFRSSNPEAIIAVDAVSSLPYPQFDFTKIDSVFFSVQKGFGLPAGLGVWIVNDRCLAKAEAMLAKGICVGTYHNLPTLYKNAQKNQTPETPNVLGIFLLSKIVEDFLRRGIKTIRQETDYKAAILYHALNSHRLIKPFVKESNFQSKTVIVANCNHYTENANQFLASFGLMAGDGYGDQKQSQLRFANFPAHSKEQFEKLVDCLEKFRG